MVSVYECIAALPDDGRSTTETLRAAVLGADPEMHESIKWSRPVFEVNGPVIALKAQAATSP